MHERFYHDDQTAQQVFDMRIDRTSDISMRDVFYIGYCINIGHATWYHHAVLLADSTDALMIGSSLLSEHIAEQLGVQATMHPVFLRNLLAEHEDVIDSASRNDITGEIDAMLASQQQDRCIIFGFIGDSQITLVNIESKSAIDAVVSVAMATHKQHGKEFFPLDVCMSHEVTHEFSARFKVAASRIRLLLDRAGVMAH